MRPLRAAPNALLTTRQLSERRFSAKDIEVMVRWGWLIRLHQGVYLVPAPDVLARAALVAAGDGAELCLESALAHLDLRPRAPSPIHVNRAGAGGPKARGGRVRVHRARIPEGDVEAVRGVRATTPTRTLLDVARRQPPYALFRALEQAERMRVHVDRARLEGCRHLALPLALFDRYGACTRSDAESMFLCICEDHRIEPPRVNQPVAGREADFHWPTARLVVEVDGYEFHADRPAFLNDRRRGGVFARVGYAVVRVDAEQVFREPDEVAATVLAALRRAA